jgi:hypothetical protein
VLRKFSEGAWSNLESYIQTYPDAYTAPADTLLDPPPDPQAKSIDHSKNLRIILRPETESKLAESGIAALPRK